MTMKKCVDTFTSYFNGVVKEIKIPINDDLLENVIDIDDLVLAAPDKIQETFKCF